MRFTNFEEEIDYEIVQLSEKVMSAKAFYRRVTAQGIGPGGWRCPCCAPAPGAAKRLWKRMEKTLGREKPKDITFRYICKQFNYI
jgi:hypothetical protein